MDINVIIQNFLLNKKYNTYQVNAIKEKIELIEPHLNDWEPTQQEWNDLILYHLIPSCKYISQSVEHELKKCKAKLNNEKNIKKYNVIATRYNYLQKQKKLKWQGLPYDDCKTKPII